MKILKFARTDPLPIIRSTIVGPSFSIRVGLVVDSGAAVTQIDGGVLRHVGYDASYITGQMIVKGVEIGPGRRADVFKILNLSVFGKRLRGIKVAAYDFREWHAFGIHGLLGFDLIRKFNLELRGPAGLLIVS